MRRLVRFGILAALALLVACDPDAAPQLHDVTITGVVDARLSYLYGEPRSFTLEGEALTLSAADPDALRVPLSVTGSLSVDGEPFLRTPVEPVPAPVDVRRIPLTTDVQVRTIASTRALLYYDGNSWFVLGEDDQAGLDLRVTPRPRSARLRGLGELTLTEADTIARYLESLGEPLVVSVLGGADVPRRSVDGLAEYRASALHVQTGLATDAGAFRPAPRTVQWEAVASGQQAVNVPRPTFRLVRTEAELRSLWNQLHGSQLTIPPLPSVDLARETVLVVMMGQRPTGGYAVDVRGVSLEGTDLFVDVRLTEPSTGAVTTSALTSPWTVVRVLRGGISAAWFRNPDDGRLFAVARRDD
jgi:hypothetical protein